MHERCRSVSYISFMSQTCQFTQILQALLELRFSFMLYFFNVGGRRGCRWSECQSLFTCHIFYREFTEKSKKICLVLSLSRRPLNVVRGTSSYGSLPILNGEKVLPLWF